MTDEESKARMNLTAIKKVDPYAIEIVDTSSHVAFYTFNSDKNEWEKTDVEGAFFIYSRNAEPRHSIFINNRLNTMSFVEPITSELELQSQPPFLLYRNERSRIRGFWFYNSEECERISKLVAEIVQSNLQEEFTVQKGQIQQQQQRQSETSAAVKNMAKPKSATGSMDIFKMLSKAQQDYNDSQQKLQDSSSDNNVMKFFAAAKGPVQPTEGQLFQRILPNTLSVGELEKQQRNRSPFDAAILKSTTKTITTTTQKQNKLNTLMADCHITKNNNKNNNNNNNNIIISNETLNKDIGSTTLSNFINAATANIKANKQTAAAAVAATTTTANVKNTTSSDLKKSLLQSISQDPSFILPNRLNATTPANKPALMLPTMFEKTSANNEASVTTIKTPIATTTTNTTDPTIIANKLINNRLLQQQQQLTLNPTQLVQAFGYLLQNDEDFVMKLHEAYIKCVSKTLLQNYQ